MSAIVEERSLSQLLRRRMEVEQHFARTGRRFRNKPWLFKQEKLWLRPLLKTSLSAVGLYERGLRNASTPVIRRFSLTYDNLPSAFDGFEILQLSDLHIDGVPGLSETLRDTLSNFHPDLCVLTGDYRFEDEGPCDDVYPHMRTILSRLSAREGVFGILGNHDAAEIAIELEQMGVRMLINEAVEIRRQNASLWLAGIDDPFDYKCDDLPAALSSVPQDGFKILLAHTPELYKEALSHGVDLYLCGHTHAGQIRLPIVGSIRHNAACPKAYSYGHWNHGSMRAYTSPGTGCSSLPVRFNCPPEIVVITLRRASASVCRDE